MPSVKRKGKYGKFSVGIHSGKSSIWYVKRIWKLQYELADSRINCLHDSTTRRHLYVLALLRFDIVENIADFGVLLFNNH